MNSFTKTYYSILNKQTNELLYVLVERMYDPSGEAFLVYRLSDTLNTHWNNPPYYKTELEEDVDQVLLGNTSGTITRPYNPFLSNLSLIKVKLTESLQVEYE